MTNDYIIGSGNVYQDLDRPDAEVMALKAKLVQEISKIINQLNLSQKEAADRLGVDQPKISAILKGKFSGYSIERLLRFLQLLDQEIIISIRPIQQQNNVSSQQTA